MAAVLSNNMKDLDKVTFFMEECKRSGINVLGPDINESFYKFAVNNNGDIRFGMGAIKGVGEGAVETIVKERKENGIYSSIFDLAKRIDLRAAYKKTFDGLAYAGGFDSFKNTHRAQYFSLDEKGQTFLEKAIRFGNKYQENKNSAQVSLFGETSDIQFPEPEIPECEEWGIMEKLSNEKVVVGIYISGHPLDEFKTELKYFCNASLKELEDEDNLKKMIGREFSFGGIVTEVKHMVGKSGKGWGIFSISDYLGTKEFRIFGEDYLKYRHFLIQNSFLYIKLMVTKGWKEDTVNIKFNNFMLLHDVLEAFSKKITLTLDIQEINKEKLEQLKNILNSYKGKKSLHLLIYDIDEKIKLNLPSRKFKINISNELLKTLEDQQLNYNLN